MSSLTTCSICLPKQQESVSSLPGEEPNVFDLTWRNYLLPSQLCSCLPFKRQQPIRLEDDDELFLNPEYHGDYLDTRGWDFDPVFAQEEQENEILPGFVTRNPFGKAKKKKKKHRVVKDYLFSDDMQDAQDAEFLGDDQIAHLAYNRYSKDMDQYGEETYLDGHAGPVAQEMQPPPAHYKEYYAARTMPVMYNEQICDEDNYCEQGVVRSDATPSIQERQLSRSPSPAPALAPGSQAEAEVEAESTCASAAVEDEGPHDVVAAAQSLLNNRLDDLTDKLIYIKQNIMDINLTPSASTSRKKTSATVALSNGNDDDDQMDRTTLHTIHNHNQQQQNEFDTTRAGSDLDSIASEALNEYETTHSDRRRSDGSQFHFHFGGNTGAIHDSPPFGSEQHPFSYFTDRSSTVNDNTPGLNIRGVLDFGKKLFG
ncbi:hypothetical protein BX666DRAFT_1874527 [Dichotomocladium elegans]|nr:hypothetical protein BX666DRAFT_1874527 [Dichotomocladium elegans]